MARNRHVALLRGINVGGNNLIRMADLRTAFERMGFADVETYIQSGNVLFAANRATTADLTEQIEQELSRAFGYSSRVVVLSGADLAAVVDRAPPGFGTDAATFRYDVLFVKPPLTPKAALEEMSTKPGVDEAHAGAHAVYFRRLTSAATRSHLPKIVGRPFYQNLTIRNWNTTRRLLERARS